jgi:hypothetical protein
MTHATTLAPAGRWTAGVHREVLPNGLTLLVQRDDSAPAVAVVTHVRAGFFDEPDHWVGISHVLEHMFFKGTPTRGVGAIARETKAAGGYLNASTSYDGTSYFVVLPASQLGAAIAVQADALRHSLIDAGELGRELQVIIQEARRKQDSPDAVAHETLFEVMFDRHRIRRWRIGREPELAGFTRDDVAGYYHSRYVPSRTVVSVVGAIEVDEAVALLRRTYGDWPAADGAVDPSPAEPSHRGVRARCGATCRAPSWSWAGTRCRHFTPTRSRSTWRRVCSARAAVPGCIACCASPASSRASVRPTSRPPSWGCSPSQRTWSRRSSTGHSRGSRRRWHASQRRGPAPWNWSGRAR